MSAGQCEMEDDRMLGMSGISEMRGLERICVMACVACCRAEDLYFAKLRADRAQWTMVTSDFVPSAGPERRVGWAPVVDCTALLAASCADQ